MCFRDFLTEKQCFFFFLRGCFFCFCFFCFFASSVFCASVSFPLLLPVCCFAVFLNVIGLPRLFLLSFFFFTVSYCFSFCFCFAVSRCFSSVFVFICFFSVFLSLCLPVFFAFSCFVPVPFLCFRCPTRLQNQRHLRGLMPVMFCFISVFIPFVFLFCSVLCRKSPILTRFCTPALHGAGVRRSAPMDFFALLFFRRSGSQY